MKTLYIIRHAKSSWANPDQQDFERGLNDRGKRDAPRMGTRLKEKNIYPDQMLSSTAKRALSTAKRIAKILNYPKDKIKVNRELYHADEETVLSVVQNLNNKHDTVFIYGHNPGLTDFVNTLMDEEGSIDNIPTCGVVAFALPIESWKEVSWGRGKMLFFDYPKRDDK